MADGRDEALREMAAHRGMRLVKSRRRKPGGDFGRYGLKDLASGEARFGFGAEGLTASADEIEAYLRKAARADWGVSAKTAKPVARRARKPEERAAESEAEPAPRRRAKVAAEPEPPVKPKPKPRPAPKPPPKPRYRVKVANLLKPLPAAKRKEAFTELLARPGIRLERIVSRGQATPEDAPMVQEHDEWVLLLQGAAGIRVEDSEEVSLGPGDWLLIGRGRPHWVTWTARDRPTVWIALHLD